MLIFIIEAILLCVLFTAGVLWQMKNPLGPILYSYPPNIVDRVIELGLVQDKDRKTPSRVRAIKKLPAAIILGVLIGAVVCFVNGVRSFCRSPIRKYEETTETGRRASGANKRTGTDFDSRPLFLYVLRFLAAYPPSYAPQGMEVTQFPTVDSLRGLPL